MVGRVQWELIQPLDDNGLFARFLAERGGGVRGPNRELPPQKVALAGMRDDALHRNACGALRTVGRRPRLERLVDDSLERNAMRREEVGTNGAKLQQCSDGGDLGDRLQLRIRGAQGRSCANHIVDEPNPRPRQASHERRRESIARAKKAGAVGSSGGRGVPEFGVDQLSDTVSQKGASK
jgi:hypothetical protein